MLKLGAGVLVWLQYQISEKNTSMYFYWKMFEYIHQSDSVQQIMILKMEIRRCEGLSGHLLVSS